MNFFFRILSTDSLKHALNSFERKPFAITARESVVFLYIQFALSHRHTRLIKRIAQTRLADETGSIVLKDNKTLVPRINGINASKRIDVTPGVTCTCTRGKSTASNKWRGESVVTSARR